MILLLWSRKLRSENNKIKIIIITIISIIVVDAFLYFMGFCTQRQKIILSFENVHEKFY